MKSLKQFKDEQMKDDEFVKEYEAIQSELNSKSSSSKPIAYGSLSKKQFDAEINKGIKDIDEDRVYSVDDVEEEILRDFIKKLKNRKR